MGIQNGQMPPVNLMPKWETSDSPFVLSVAEQKISIKLVDLTSDDVKNFGGDTPGEFTLDDLRVRIIAMGSTFTYDYLLAITDRSSLETMYKECLQEQLQNFSKDDVSLFAKNLKILQERLYLAALSPKLQLPSTIYVFKTSGHEEFGAFYSRQKNVLCFAQSSLRPCDFFYLSLAGAFFYVIQRNNEDVRRHLCSGIGFEPIDPKWSIPSHIREQIRTNIDFPDCSYWFKWKKNTYIPLRIAKSTLDDKKQLSQEDAIKYINNFDTLVYHKESDKFYATQQIPFYVQGKDSTSYCPIYFEDVEMEMFTRAFADWMYCLGLSPFQFTSSVSSTSVHVFPILKDVLQIKG